MEYLHLFFLACHLNFGTSSHILQGLGILKFSKAASIPNTLGFFYLFCALSMHRSFIPSIKQSKNKTP